jgi:hypothetical protein
MTFAFRHILHKPSIGGGGGGGTTVTYSTLIGLGVDTIGYADLTPRVGASIFYVNPGTGSDSNTGLSHAQALNTVGAALAKVSSGRGDHILLAEGSSTSETMPQLVGKDGFSAQYPFVIQSYNPADPTNQAYWGRGYQRNARPKLTSGIKWTIASASGTVNPPNFLAIRGLDFDCAAVTDLTIEAYPQNNTPASYWLLEGNLFRYYSISFAMILGAGTYPRNQALQSDTIIIRNNSGRGNFSTTQSEGGSGLYLDGWKGYIVVEDNVWYHRGWSETAARGDDYTIGGPDKFKHTAYLQTTNDATIYWRRNLSSDGAADGGQLRSNSIVTENLYIDNPISMSVGGGTQYDIYQPNGIYGEVAYNVAFGSVDFAPGDPAGAGIYMLNTTSLSVAYRNLWARSFSPSTSNGTFIIGSDYSGTSTLADVHNNIAYLWASTGNTFAGTDQYDQVTDSFENNYTDAAALGSNLNISSLTPPNAYTAPQFYTAMYAAVPAIGAATKTAFINYATAYPEAHVQRTARQLLFDGYGVTNSCGDLAMRSNFVVGVPSTIVFVGGTPGSTFTGTLPAGFTLNSSARSITYDGSGSAIDSNFTITETPLVGSPKINTVPYRVLSQAATTLNPSDKSANITLSGGNLIAKAPSALAAVRAVRALGSGKYHWEFIQDVAADICSPCVLDSSANLDVTHYFALTADAHGAGYYSGTFRYNTTAQSVTLALSQWWWFEYDGAAQLLWIGDSTGCKNGNPAAGTGGLLLSGMGASRFVGFQGDGNDKAKLNFGDKPFAYAPTSGFGNN